MPQALSQDRPPAPARRTRWSVRLIACLVSAVLALALVEIGLRLLGFGPGVQVADPRDPAVLHPETFIAEAQRQDWLPWPLTEQRVAPLPEHPRGYVVMKRNRCSFREDDETPLAKPAGTIRIMVTGDSHTDGVVFNAESYANLLEAALDQESDAVSYDVINAGFGKSSPYQQLWAYQKVLRRFAPDQLVVGFYAGNDLMELLRHDDRVHLERDGSQWVHAPPRRQQDTTTTSHGAWERTKQVLRDHLAIYRALASIAWLRGVVRATVADEYRERLEQARQQGEPVVWQGLNQAYYFQHHPEQWSRAAEMLRFILEQWREQTRRDDTGLVIVVIPTLRQIHPESDRQRLQAAIGTLALSVDAVACDERACDLVVQQAAALQVPVVDLRGPFREIVRDAPDRQLYYRFDHHLNVDGNRATARLLYQYFARRLDQITAAAALP